MSNSINIENLIRSTFEPEVVELLHSIAVVAEDKNFKIFLVGGLVRDLLLGNKSKDIDILVEGKGIDLANELKLNWSHKNPNFIAPSKIVTFSRYQTAKLLFPQEIFSGVLSLDFSSTRQETYPLAGKPPTVSPSDLNRDLGRRDFSVNALAVEITADKKFLLHDLHFGIEDLNLKQLKILHPNSFLDDPARLIRAQRFMERFSFELEQSTAIKFQEAIKGNYIQLLPPQRLFSELQKTLAEDNAPEILFKMGESGLLSQILPEYNLENLSQAKNISWQKLFYKILGSPKKEKLEEILKSFDLVEKERAKLIAACVSGDK